MPRTSSAPPSGTSGPKSGSIEARLKAAAFARGFTLAGIAPAADADGFGAFRAWLDAGHAGEMTYLADKRDLRRHPAGVFDPVRSVVMLGFDYGPGSSNSSDTTARVAGYAQHADYHALLWDKLNDLRDWLAAEVPGTLSHGVSDSAPLLERDFARRAGLGWVGKNTMLLNKERGSFFLLAAFLTSLELTPDEPFAAGHCGTCTACLDACPTGAFVGPGVLDARRCISYLTIELKSAIPQELRPGIGAWLFGCDVCQDVCPWNRKAAANPAFPTDPRLADIDAVEVLGLSAAEYAMRFAGTPLADRGRFAKVRRNAAVVLGNIGDARAVPALETAARDPDPVVAEAAAWALGRIRRDRPG